MVAKVFAVIAIAVMFDAGPAFCRGCSDDDYYEYADTDSYTDTDSDTDTDTDADTDTDSDTESDPEPDGGMDGGAPDAGMKTRQQVKSKSSVSVLIQYYESLRK